jgi:hypothetical protein
MNQALNKKIELFANVSIILVACLLAVVLVKNYLLAPAQPHDTVEKNGQLQGQKLTSLDVDWKQNGQTLLLAISSGCHFCTESASFYKQLAKDHRSTRLVAVLPQPINEGKRYLDGLGVPVDDIKQAELNSINVQGTPTLILVNSDGVVVDSWIGKLADDKQKEVLIKVAGGALVN